MEISSASQGDTRELMELWDICFPGDGAFRSFFFSEIYDPSSALVCREGGKIGAMLHIIPMEIELLGDRLKLGYIYGVGTHPEERGRGLAAKLVDTALFRLNMARVPLCALVPQEESLFGYYARFGFSPRFRLRRTEIARRVDPDYSIRQAGIGDIGELDAIYEKAFEGLAHMKRSKEHWRLLLMEAERAGGGAVIAESGGGAKGFAVYNEQERMVIVSEAVGLDRAARDAAACAALEAAGADSGIIYLPAKGDDPAGSFPFGAVRIVNAARVLEAYAKGRPSDERAFALADSYCPWNSRAYRLHGGGVTQPEENAGPDVIGPEELCGIVFSNENGSAPYMNLMHD